MKRKAAIIGISSTKLKKSERYILKKFKPWGVILFSRNIKNLLQLKHLIKDIKFNFKDKKGRNLVLRPEGTAGLTRHYLSKKYVSKKCYYYIEQMFRR